MRFVSSAKLTDDVDVDVDVDEGVDVVLCNARAAAEGTRDIGIGRRNGSGTTQDSIAHDVLRK